MTSLKKGPGRPRKTQPKILDDRIGLVYEPPSNDPNILVDFVYKQPVNIKKIFTLFDNIGCRDISFIFKQASIEMIVTDHYNKSAAKAVINCLNVHSYYCDRDIIGSGLKITLPNTFIIMLVNLLDKGHQMIGFILFKDSYTKKLHVVSQHAVGISQIDQIKIIENSEKPIDHSFIDEKYPLKLSLPSSYFKRILNNCKKISQIFRIEKSSDGPLNFVSDHHEGTIKSNFLLNDIKDANLYNIIPAEDIFCVRVDLTSLIQFSNSLISKIVRLSFCMNQPLIMTYSLDDTITVIASINTTTALKT